MELDKYTNIIEDIIDKIKNGNLNPSNFKDYVLDKYGVNMSNTSNYLQDLEEVEQLYKEHEFDRLNQDIRTNIIKIIKHTNSIIDNPNPFTIKYNSIKLKDLFEEQKELRKKDSYDEAFKRSIDFINEYSPDLKLNKELIKMLKHNSEY